MRSSGVSDASETGRSTALSRWMVRLAIAVYLVLGVFPYLASGLMVPPRGLLVLMACWAAGLVATILLARERPIIAPVAVVVAIMFWFLYLTIGSALFGWTA